MTSKPTASPAVKASKNKPKKSAAKAVTSPDSPNDAVAALLTERPTDSANGSQRGGEKTEKGEKEYIKEVSKRLRRQTKKMENIKRSEDKIKDLTEEEQATTILINPDERSKIASKPITSAVFKELNEIHDVLKKVAEADDKRVEEEKAEAEAKFTNAVAEAREEGRQAGLEEAAAKIFTVVKFLRLAGYRRQQKSGDDQEDDAIERILVLVYGGDQTAVDACMKLANGAEDRVDGFDATFAQIKETAHALKLPGEEDQSEEPEAEAATTEAETAEITISDVQLSTQEGDNDDPPTDITQLEVSEESVPLPQTYANGEAEAPAVVPASPITTDDATNEEAKAAEPVEAASESTLEAVVSSEPSVETINPEPVNDIPTAGSWADDETKPEAEASPENKEFQSVERRGRGRGGHRGGPRGDFRGYRSRGGHRGDRGGEYRGRGGGEYRGRGDGEYRGRGDGEYRSRGDGEYRGRGDGEYRHRSDGEYRGRGGYRSNRERGDGENRGGYRGRGRGDHQNQGGQQQQQQQAQPAIPT